MKRPAILFASLAICMPMLSLAATEENPKPVTVENEPTVQVGNTVGVNVANVPTVDVGNTVAVDVLTTPDSPDIGIDQTDSPRLVQLRSTCETDSAPFSSCLNEEHPPGDGKIVSIMITARSSSGAETCIVSASVSDPAVLLSAVTLGQIASDAADSVTIPLAVPISVESDDSVWVDVRGADCAGSVFAHVVVE